MARSLTVQHEENVTTSPLLTGFLLFAVAWMIIGAVVAAKDAGAAPVPPADAVVQPQ